jgi:hypothetical protein
VNSSGRVGIPGLHHEPICSIDDLLGVVALRGERREERKKGRG